jgi:hypothetical protein
LVAGGRDPDIYARADPEECDASAFDMQRMKRVLMGLAIALGITVIALAHPSSGKSAAEAGTGTSGGASRSSETGTQSQPGTAPQNRTIGQSDGANQTGASTTVPSTAGPVPNRTGSTEASPDGLRPAAPGIPSGIRVVTPHPAPAPDMTGRSMPGASPEPSPTAIPTATPDASPTATPGVSPSATPSPLK